MDSRLKNLEFQNENSFVDVSIKKSQILANADSQTLSNKSSCFFFDFNRTNDKLNNEQLWFLPNLLLPIIKTIAMMMMFQLRKFEI